MSTKISASGLEKLLSATTYREFAITYQEEMKNIGKSLNFSDIARRGEFSSRSFPREVLLGKKGLTLQSLYKFSTGLGLIGDLADYFHLLVQLEHEECRIRKVSDERLKKSLDNLRQRLYQKEILQNQKEKDGAFNDECLPMVYAGLGEQNRGALLSEIKARTSLGKEEIVSSLSRLVELGLAEKISDRYYARSNHIGLLELGKSSSYQKFFRYLLDKSAAVAKEKFDSREALFFSSCLSVNKKDLPLMRDELRSVLLKYVDQAEEATGDKVVSIVCSMF